MAEPLISRGIDVELGTEGPLAVFVLGTLVHQASVVAVIRPPFRVWLYEVLLDLRAELLADPSESAEQRIVTPDGVATWKKSMTATMKKIPMTAATQPKSRLTQIASASAIVNNKTTIPTVVNWGPLMNSPPRPVR
jgi:hypothetical protein